MINNYEAMLIVNPNLNEEQKKSLFSQLNETIVKNQGEIANSGVWSEKRKFCYPIKKFQEGIYYHITFKIAAGVIVKLKQAYRLNENIIRMIILREAAPGA